MSAFWIDWLRTPMAAPETPRLKAMRMTILVLCFTLPVLVTALAPLRAAIGLGAGAAIAVLVTMLFVLVPYYVIAKNSADGAFLDATIEGPAE